MYCVVLITTKTTLEAKNISKKLLEAKLIACSNIIKNVDSIFWWNKRINQSKETLLVLKTKKRLFKKIPDAK